MQAYKYVSHTWRINKMKAIFCFFLIGSLSFKKLLKLIVKKNKILSRKKPGSQVYTYVSHTWGTLYTYYIAIDLKNRGFSCDFTLYNILLALSYTILRYTVFQKYTWQRTSRPYCNSFKIKSPCRFGCLEVGFQFL